LRYSQQSQFQNSPGFRTILYRRDQPIQIRFFKEVIMLRRIILVVLAPLLFGSMLFTKASQAAAVNGNFVTKLKPVAGKTPFLGVLAGGVFEARSTSQKTRITAQITGRSVVGAITLEDGQVLSFRAKPATGNAGLFRSDDLIENQRWLGGWVVLADGDQRGAVIGMGSTRPGRKLEFVDGVAGVNLPGAGALKPFQVTAAFLASL
jgi:hypothetical protein